MSAKKFANAALFSLLGFGLAAMIQHRIEWTMFRGCLFSAMAAIAIMTSPKRKHEPIQCLAIQRFRSPDLRGEFIRKFGAFE